MEAIRILKDKNYKIELTIVGDGSYTPFISKMVHEFELEEFIKLVGAIDDSNKISSITRLQISTFFNLSEGFPYTL